MPNTDNIEETNFKEEKDKFDIEQEIVLKELIQCQKSRNINSCMKCDKDFFKCELRKKYEEKTYYKMNKNTTGGFDF